MTVFALTEPHSDYPAYVNLSERDGALKLSVRTRGNGGKDYASIVLTETQAEELAEAIFKHVYAADAPALPAAPAPTVQAGELPPIRTWTDRGADAGWTSHNMVYIDAEIADLRAAIAMHRAAAEPAPHHPICEQRGYNPLCKGCEAERAAEPGPTDDESLFFPPKAMLKREDWDTETRKPRAPASQSASEAVGVPLDFTKPLETVQGKRVTWVCSDVIEIDCARVCVDQSTGIVYSSPYIGAQIRNLTAPAAPTDAKPLPKVSGVSRDAESPGQKSVLVAFDRRLTDDELRALHDRLVSAPTNAGVRDDAARYHWLRDKSEPGICAFYLSVGAAFKGVKFARKTVDEAIDAAMAESSPQAPKQEGGDTQ